MSTEAENLASWRRDGPVSARGVTLHGGSAGRAEQRTGAPRRPPEARDHGLLRAVLASTLLTRSDARDVFVFVSSSARTLLGFHPAAMRGHRYDEYIPDDERARVAELRALVREGGTVRTLVHRHRTAGGDLVWLETAMWRRRRRESVEPDVFTSSTDVTKRIDAERHAAQGERLMRLAVERSPIGMAVVDGRGRWVDTNPVFLQMIGYEAPELAATTFEELVAPKYRPPAQQMIRAAAGKGPANSTAEVPVVRRDGVEVWMRLVATPLPSDDELHSPVLVQAIDIGPQRSREQALLEQALHDPLTGAGNRRLLEDRIRDATSGGGPLEGNVAVVMLDLDDFKELNDRLGHRAGDQVLTAVADRLRHAVREQDTVARLGGDEFAVVLPGVPAERALQLRNLLRVALRRPIVAGGHAIPVTASVGMALARAADTPDTLLERADHSMYKDKRRHRLQRPRGEPVLAAPLEEPASTGTTTAHV